MNVAERAWYLPAGFPLCLWPSIAVQMPEPPQQVEEKGGRGKNRACSQVYEGQDDLGNFLQIHCHRQPAHGRDVGQITQGTAAPGWWKVLQKHLFYLDGSNIFKNMGSAKAHIS